MATKTKASKPKKKAPAIDVDPQLPGMEDERDEALLLAAKRYLTEMRARKAAGEEEVAAHEALKQLMHKKCPSGRYKYGNISIVLDMSEKVKVKDNVAENGDGKEDAGEE